MKAAQIDGKPYAASFWEFQHKARDMSRMFASL